MHKIKKGIKKKIKGKKGKHEEDDLFDPEQLEKYRRELEEAKAAKAAAGEGGDSEDHNCSEAAGPSSESTGAATKTSEEDEEWQKFKQLTSGIDQILKKTSGDLDRIKSSSYFQRLPPKPDFIIPPSVAASSSYSRAQSTHVVPESTTKEGSGRWVDLESGRHHSVSDGEGEDGTQNQVPEGESRPEDEELEEKRPETPDVEPVEVEDDLFDTSFVDAIAAGDIKLAYIPDSPTEEEEGDDPFDTSAVADVVKKIEEEEKKKKRQVNLGLAVNVLTGKEPSGGALGNLKEANKPALDTRGTKRPRPRPTNLLAFDDNGEAQLALSPTADSSDNRKKNEEPETLFDSLLACSPPAVDSEGAIPIVKAPLPATSPVPTVEKSQSSLNLDELISEFDVIKEVPNIPAVPLEDIFNPVDDLEDEFAALAAESIHKDTPATGKTSATPERPPPPHLAQTPLSPVDNEPDPFDTTFVEKLPIGKSELKLVEKEVLGDKPAAADDDDDFFDFDPRAGEEPREVSNLIVQKDLLGGSACDLTSLSGADPIAPESHGLIETEIHDPFDTSVVEKLLPGKAELKLLEQELLKSPTGPPPIPPLPSGFAAADDDFDFDPRKDEKSIEASPAKPPSRPPPPKAPQIHPLDLPAEPSHQVELGKALTPVEISLNEGGEPEIDDPFDTSNVSDVIAPGKTELKLLESELVSNFTPVLPPAPINYTSVQGSVVGPIDDDDDFNPRAGTEQVVPQVPTGSLVETVVEPIFDSAFDIQSKDKPLTPLAPPTAESDFDDPFDTSNLVSDTFLPGKAELKFLEKELLDSVEDVKPPTLPEVILPPPKPVVPPPPKTPEPHPLDELEPAGTVAHEPLRPLTPSHLEQGLNFDDPFDTSIASTAGPGKAELKILEKELDSLHDPDFDPRQPAFPPVRVPSQPLVPVSVSQQSAQAVAVDTADEIDPFDTSAAENVLPGKAELKILEAELL